MKTLKFILGFAALSISFASFIPSATAQAAGQGRQFGAGDRFFPALNRVLTDEQRKSFLTGVELQSEKIRPLEEKIRASRSALFDAIASGKFDEAAARQNADESAKAEAELTMIFAKALSEMKPPLSAQQIQQMKNFQPGQFQQQDQSAPQTEAVPPPKMDFPPPLPRDSNDLPIVTPPK